MNVLFFWFGFGRMSFCFLICTVVILLAGVLGFATLLTALNIIAFWGMAFIVLYLAVYLLTAIIGATGGVGLGVISFLLFMVAIFGGVTLFRFLEGIIANPLFGTMLIAGLRWIGFVIVTLILLNLPNIFMVALGYISAGLVPTVPAGSSTPSPSEEAWRSYMVGLNTSMNLLLSFAVYAIIFHFFISNLVTVFILASLLALILASVNYMSIFIASTTNPTYKSILGFFTLLMPMAWFVNSLGLLLYIISLMFHFLSLIGPFPIFRITTLTIRSATTSIVNFGGLCANLNPIHTAYNLGNFILIDATIAGGLAPTTAHEDGHHLSLGSMGSNFHFVGWIYEMFLGTGTGAYAEQLAEGNIAGTTASPQIDVWNT